MNGKRSKDEISYEIKERVGVLSSHSNGWSKELNVISWNGGESKYDIREWNPDHKKMSRGLTLSPAEMQKTVDLMGGRL